MSVKANWIRLQTAGLEKSEFIQSDLCDCVHGFSVSTALLEDRLDQSKEEQGSKTRWVHGKILLARLLAGAFLYVAAELEVHGHTSHPKRLRKMVD